MIQVLIGMLVSEYFSIPVLFLDIASSNRGYELDRVTILIGLELLESQENFKPRLLSEAERKLFCCELTGNIELTAGPHRNKTLRKISPEV